jgi:hypothetical protein
LITRYWKRKFSSPLFTRFAFCTISRLKVVSRFEMFRQNRCESSLLKSFCENMVLSEAEKFMNTFSSDAPVETDFASGKSSPFGCCSARSVSGDFFCVNGPYLHLVFCRLSQQLVRQLLLGFDQVLDEVFYLRLERLAD